MVCSNSVIPLTGDELSDTANSAICDAIAVLAPDPKTALRGCAMRPMAASPTGPFPA